MLPMSCMRITHVDVLAATGVPESPQQASSSQQYQQPEAEITLE
jgi:hypothetical protein